MERIRPTNRLVEWVQEREALRINKEAGNPPPWTDDPILREYRFCNVRRRDDRVSKWLIANVLNRMDHFELWTFLQWSAIGRWINWPGTLGAVLVMQFIKDDDINYAGLINVVESRRQQELKAWTGAYIIRAPSKRGGYGGMPKSAFVIDVCIKQGMESVKAELMEQFTKPGLARCADVHKILSSIHNWGDFMAGQVVADWTYTDLLKNAPDLYTWAPMGPGSRRGFNRMMHQPLKQPAPTQEVWNSALRDWRDDILERIGLLFDGALFTLHDVQNCLCEWDKYERTRLGEGRPRARYNWRHAQRELL